MTNKTTHENYKKSGLVIFCNGTTTGGNNFYAYVLMSTDSYERYQDAVDSNESYDLEDFGLIINEGDTLEPSKKTKSEMKLLYNIDHNLEEKHEKTFKTEKFKNGNAAALRTNT